jgi:hypothetical protein
MKIICPHCGVKGTADSSRPTKKVRCPKCKGVFEVTAKIFQSVPFEVTELEQIHDPVETDLGITSEEEVDDVFSKLLLGDEAIPVEIEDTDLLDDDFNDRSDDELIAALSDLEDGLDAAGEGQDQDWADEDETLTIIEDFPEEALNGFDGLGSAAEDDRITLEDDEWAPADESDEPDLEELQSQAPGDESGDEMLSFEDGVEDEPDSEYPELSEETAEEETSRGEEEVEVDESFADEMYEDLGEDTNPIYTEAPTETDEGERLENEGTAIQKCSACSEYVDPDAKHEFNGNVYCSKCVPAELKQRQKEERAAAAALIAAAAEQEAKPGRFTIGTLIKDAWHYSKGVKGAIWAGIFAMYLLLIGIGVAAVFLLPKITGQVEPLQAVLVESGLQVGLSLLYFIFTAGLIKIAVNKIGQKPFSWKMIFSGFSRFGSLLLLFILQTIMMVIGLVLFILPGIYLSIGYILAIPLIFERGLSPWQALEVSRKAVHKRWWTVFFALIAMSILMTVSTIPLGLGLIWTIPMLIILIGVLYYHFFGAEE